jgi:trehalose 6-phosphate phosphatase
VTYWYEAKDSIRKVFNYERVGMITDMDGTLRPIVPVPSAAQPTERNRKLLRDLNQKLALVAVVSGRAVQDVYQRVNLPELVYAGNHGLERWQNGEVVASPQAARYRSHLEAAIQTIKPQMPAGMWIEDKQVTLSIHYRDTANPTQTARTFQPIFAEIADNHNLKLFQGRMIFELRPPLNVDKGTIFKQLVEEYKLQAALYIGDDTTDADALKMAQSMRESGACYGLAVGVDSDETPAVVLELADVLVFGVTGVEDFLDWFLKAAIASDI